MKRAAYLKTRGLTGPWQLEGCRESAFSGAVVIPSLAESAHLAATLASLALCPADERKRFLIVVVVNHRPDAAAADKADNQTTLELLRAYSVSHHELNLAWVDAASPGYELPLKGGGVGLARKLGCDLALSRLDLSSGDPLLICLDADTLVRPDYLTALQQHFAVTDKGATTIHFLHQSAATPDGQHAIERYELFLRSYVLGLQLACSPYAFHSVGSAMACRVSAYLKIGGMNSRSAGEDFYFLQQLARIVGVATVAGTVVYPSARASHRVPFGTGRTISRILDTGQETLLFYHSDCFRILGAWLEIVAEHRQADSSAITKLAAEVSPDLWEYLDTIHCADIWNKLQRNHPAPESFLKAFHDWFDGLKTMRLIHHLSATTYPRCEPEIALPPLFSWGNLPCETGCSRQLETLRKLQLGDDYSSPDTISTISAESFLKARCIYDKYPAS